MDTKEAIKKAHNFALGYGDSKDIEAIQHLIDIAKRFEGAVGVVMDEDKHLLQFANESGSIFLKKHKLYAVLKLEGEE